MMLIYSRETPDPMSPEDERNLKDAHWAVIDETSRRGILKGAEPLAPISSATTVRSNNGRVMITDGPFAETKEQLAGYYILECKDLDEALEWAAKIPTGCRGGEGCIEVRPMPGLPSRNG
jgi:hypothetical protein